MTIQIGRLVGLIMEWCVGLRNKGVWDLSVILLETWRLRIFYERS